MKKMLLFVESNTTGTGMLAIKKAKELGYDPVFLTKKKDLYTGLSDLDCRVIELDTNSIDTMKDFILKQRLEQIAGILTTSDYYLESVAELANHFQLIGNSLESIHSCRNKAMFRKKLYSENILQPKFQIVNSIDSLQEIKKSIELPCVVKPSNDSGSNNVRLCFNWEEVNDMAAKILDNKFNARGQKTTNTVLLEEYIEGPEYSVEMFTWEGNSLCVGITEKHLTGYPYFVESSHIFPTKVSENLKFEIEQIVRRALQVVDFRYGSSHSEVKLTPNGCVMIEINARLAGGMIPELIYHSTGLDVLRKQILSSVGVAPDWKEIEHSNYAGIHFIISNKTGTLSDITGIEEIKKLPYVKEILVKARVGQLVYQPENFSHRLGHIIVQGKTYEETVVFLEEAVNKLELQVSSIVQPFNR